VARFEDDESFDGLESIIVAEDSLSFVATPKMGEHIKLQNGQLSGPLMVYAPGTAYGAHISKALKRQNIRISERPICESASAEALLAQVKAGFGAAWLPALLIDKDLKRCRIPNDLDIPYQIVQVKAVA
jgi:DNA-binding transcriptional LysR family regulator